MYKFSGLLGELIAKGQSGKSADVDRIMAELTEECDFATTRYVDFALSRIETTEGLERIRHYLFKGSQIQRNYASLYLNRRGEWKTVREAFDKGLIDEIQAFAR